MKRENFVTQITQIISILSTIALALSQYIFRDYLRFLFNDGKYYSLASFIALIISIIVMIALYSNRYTLQLKYYFNTKKKEDYYKYLNLSPEQKEKEKKISEPRHISIKRISIWSIFILPILVLVIIMSNNVLPLVFISYILFICLAVFSLSTFAIQLYLENDFQNKEEQKLNETLDKIKSYFAGEIRIRWMFKDTSDWLNIKRILLIERNNKMYRVTADVSDPNKYFYIEEDKSFSTLDI